MTLLFACRRPQDAVPRKYAKMTGFYSGNGEDGEDDDGDDDDGDGDGGDDAVDQLTTRRKAGVNIAEFIFLRFFDCLASAVSFLCFLSSCSGRALSNFASGFRGRVLPFVLPSIKAGLAATVRPITRANRGGRYPSLCNLRLLKEGRKRPTTFSCTSDRN